VQVDSHESGKHEKVKPKQKNGDDPGLPGIEELPIERVELVSSQPAI
jgi:hypothetical protein